MNVRRITTLVTLLTVTTLVFSACSSTAPDTTSTGGEEQAPGMTTEKKGDTTISGKLTNKGGKYFLEQIGKQPQEVESYSVDLSTYAEQSVTITGQFSGDTLFAAKVEAQAQ